MLEIPKAFTLYQQVKILDYPRDQQQQIQGRDYEVLHPGDALFLDFNCEVICYQGESLVTPFFINEATYYEKNYALGLAIQQQ